MLRKVQKQKQFTSNKRVHLNFLYYQKISIKDFKQILRKIILKFITKYVQFRGLYIEIYTFYLSYPKWFLSSSLLIKK